jgi:hypothetical protein
VGEEIDERAGGRFYGIAVGIDSVRLDGSQVPGGKNADLAIKWRYRDPTRRITLDLPRSKTGKPASSTICCRPCTARATRCYSRGDVAHEPDLRSRHSGWAPLSRTRQCERQPLGGPKSLVWVKGGCHRQADGTAGLPSAPEMPSASRQLRLVPIADVRRTYSYRQRLASCTGLELVPNPPLTRPFGARCLNQPCKPS